MTSPSAAKTPKNPEALARARARMQALFAALATSDPWPADRVERRDPATYQRRSVVMIRICANPFCRNWTPTRLRCCIVCHQPPIS